MRSIRLPQLACIFELPAQYITASDDQELALPRLLDVGCAGNESAPAQSSAIWRKRDVTQDEKEDTTIYKVVVNDEEQYSIWPADRENALGWNDAGKSGTKAECLAYIEEVWTDMRPLSLRKKMEGG